jgi:putative membrane protein
MWHYGDAMGLFGWTMMIVFWAVVVALVIWTIRNARPARDAPRSDALALLERRFASGEIERDEFEEKKELLTRT